MTAITTRDQLPLSDDLAPVPDPAANVLAAMVHAVQQGGLTTESTAALEKLTDLYERMQDRNARTAFNAALAKFQSECPKIPRNKTAKIVSKRSGASFGYSYAGLDDVAATVDPVLRKHGLAYTWDSDIRDSLVHVTAIVRHVDGHEARATFAVPVESDAGNAPAQKYEVALTYGMRRSLILALGLTWTDPDPEDREPEERLDEHQVIEIEELLEVNGITGDRLTKFKRYLGVEAVTEIPASRYENVKVLIRRAAKQAEKEAAS